MAAGTYLECLDESARDARMALVAGHIERGKARFVAMARLRAGGEKRDDDVLCTDAGGNHERRPLVGKGRRDKVDAFGGARRRRGGAPR